MNNDNLLKIILASDADQIIKLLVAKNTADEDEKVDGINAE